MKKRLRFGSKWVGLIVSFLFTLAAFSVQAQEGGFTEPFDDPALPGWEHSPNVEVVNGVLRIGTNGYALRGGEWGDLNLIVRGRLEGEGLAAIGYRVSDFGEYAIHISTNEITLLRAGEPIAQEMIETIPPEEWFFVEMMVMGESHEIYLNGQPVIHAVDPDPLPFGGVMLSVQGEAVGEFDDLSVFSTSEALPPEEPEPEEPEPEETELPDEPAPTQETSEPLSPDELAWVRTGGPPGGVGYDIRYKFDEPTTWFVTDNFAGVHKSTDNGLTWTTSNSGIPRQFGPTGDWRPIFSLTVDPHKPDIIWAGTDKTGHIYKSIDGGGTWTQKDTGVNQTTSEYEMLTFRGFTIDPNTSDVVYAMGEIAVYAIDGDVVWGDSIGGIIYKTTDGGENWEVLWNGGIPSSLARYMWINPEDTNILYVSTGIFDRSAVNEGDPGTDPNPYGGLGILKSTDGGKSWRILNEANGLNFLYIGSLFMHPDDPDILIASAGKGATDLFIDYLKENNLSTPMGVYRTSDGGETWTQVLGVSGFDVVEMCPSDPNIAYAASANLVYRSEDAGVTWTQVAGQGGNGWGPPGILAGTPIDFQCDPNDPDRLFANNYLGGNFLTEDGGKTWINASDGYTGAQIISLVVDPTNPAQIYVAGRNGIWASSDGGNSWYGLRYPPAGQIVWGGEWGGIAIDPSDSKHLLVSEETFWESFDGGSSWEVRQSPNFALAAAIVFAPSDPNTVYSGRADTICLVNSQAPCRQGSGIFVSHDGGKTWEYANDSNIENQSLIDLAVDPTDANYVYAATQEGLFKTTNGGVSWTVVAGLPDGTRVGTIVIHPQDSQKLMAGVEMQGLYISADGGQTWQQIAAGLQPNSSIRDILYDPTDLQTVYLSDIVSGVYRSTDGGLTWTKINNGLTTRSTTGLAISSDGQHLYAATSGEGVFRLDLNGQPPVSQGNTPTTETEKPSAEGESVDEPPKSISDDDATSETSGVPIGIVIGIVLAVIVIGLVIIIITRRRVRKG